MKPLLLATLLWARALSVDDAEIVIDVGVDGASRPLVVSADDEPQWAASRFCAEHHLSDSTEGFPCASMLAEEIITQGGRYDVRSSAADATAAALGWEPRGGGGGGGGGSAAARAAECAATTHALALRRGDDRDARVRALCARLGLFDGGERGAAGASATECDALRASVDAAVPESALGAGALRVPIEVLSGARTREKNE